MNYSKSSIWIDKEFKSYYNDSKQSGLRLHFDPNIDPVIKEKIKALFLWLRRKYFFPFRCEVYLLNQKKIRSKDNELCQGIFSYPKEQKPTWYKPQIYLAVDTDINVLYHTLFHELTHYYQWYFLDMEDGKRTDRSLEIEANKYADWLLYEYLGNNWP